MWPGWFFSSRHADIKGGNTLAKSCIYKTLSEQKKKTKKHRLLSVTLQTSNAVVLLRPHWLCYLQLAVMSINRPTGKHASVKTVVVNVSGVLSLSYKALLPLSIWVNGFPLLDSPRLPYQPPLHLFSTHLHLTLQVFLRPPLLIPLEEMFNPTQPAPSCPWGMGQLKMRQELSGAVMSSLRWDLARIAAEAVRCFGIGIPKIKLYY